jgi:hypothetical protein
MEERAIYLPRVYSRRPLGGILWRIRVFLPLLPQPPSYHAPSTEKQCREKEPISTSVLPWQAENRLEKLAGIWLALSSWTKQNTGHHYIYGYICINFWIAVVTSNFLQIIKQWNEEQEAMVGVATSSIAVVSISGLLAQLYVKVRLCRWFVVIQEIFLMATGTTP